MIDGTALTQVARPLRDDVPEAGAVEAVVEHHGAARDERGEEADDLAVDVGQRQGVEPAVRRTQLVRLGHGPGDVEQLGLAEADGLARSGRSGAEQHAATLGSGLARARPVHRHPVRGPRDRVDMEDRQGADGRVVERRHRERAAAGGHHRENRLRGRVRVERHDGGPRADQADEQGAEGHRVGRQQAHPLAGDTVGPPPRHARRQLRPVDDPVAPGRLQPRHRRGGRGLRRHHPCEDPLSLF